MKTSNIFFSLLYWSLFLLSCSCTYKSSVGDKSIIPTQKIAFVDSLNNAGVLVNFDEVIDKQRDSINLKNIEDYVSFRDENIYKNMMKHDWAILIASQFSQCIDWKITLYSKDSFSYNCFITYYKKEKIQRTWSNTWEQLDSFYYFMDELEQVVLAKKYIVNDYVIREDFIYYNGKQFFYLNSHEIPGFCNIFIEFFAREQEVVIKG